MSIYEKVTTLNKDKKTHSLNFKAIVKYWESHWLLSQWHEKFRFIIPDKRSNESCVIKVSIPLTEARQLIKKLNLEEEKSGIYRHASSWRK